MVNVGGVARLTRSTRGWRTLQGPVRDRGRDEGTYRLRVDTDLRRLLEEDDLRFIRIRVFGRDAVSGIGAVAEQQYHDPGAEVMRGKFVKGPTFDIV